MKLIIGVIAIIILLVFLGLKWFANSSNQPCPEPDKPEVVPSSAVWKGGCDGGTWIELVSIENDSYRFKVYRDYDGALLLDANFQPKGCEQLIISKSNWSSEIEHFINESIVLNSKCRLIPIYPAYGGEDWKAREEKQ